MFLDACRDPFGGAKGGTSIGDDSSVVVGREGAVTFFSCNPWDLSYEIKDLGHSSFTHNILKAIKDPACVTVDEVDKFLRTEVPLTNKNNKKPPQQPYTIWEPSEKGKLIIFGFGEKGIVELEIPRYDDLCNKLSERYIAEVAADAQGKKLDPSAVDMSIDIIIKIKEGSEDEESRKMLKFVEDYCADKISSRTLGMLLQALQRGRLKEPDIQHKLEQLK